MYKLREKLFNNLFITNKKNKCLLNHKLKNIELSVHKYYLICCICVHICL